MKTLNHFIQYPAALFLATLYKRIPLLFLAILLLGTAALGQSPDAFKYQAVARDASGQVLTSHSVSFRISMIQGSASGTNVYSETHSAVTNDFGLINLVIGNGTVESGDFAGIDWGSDSFFVQIEMDENGGTNFQMMGTSQLLSVPYALHAQTARNGSKKYQIGDSAQGGIVFWVDESGEHGLVAASTDQSTGIAWKSGNSGSIVYAKADGIGAGVMNSIQISIINNPSNSYAAILCVNFSVSDSSGALLGDWYLPSMYELNLMYANLHMVGLGSFSTVNYWSSISGSDCGMGIDFTDGSTFCVDPFSLLHVRAIRRF